VQDQSPNPFVSSIDQENQSMNHSDLKTIEFAAYIGLDWADQKHDICLQENHSHRLERNSPIPREIELPSQGKIIAIPQVGGLHHRYRRAA
jgi:hypothetical protein